jgi:hypothetical protein
MGALGGGWLIGVWAFGLVLIVESAGLCWLGLARDDEAPVVGRVHDADVLEHARRVR